MFLFVSLPMVKRGDAPRARQNSLACPYRQGAAAIGLVGGLLAALCGALLTAVSWLITDASLAASLHQLGGALLCATIPLLMLGACCLDGIESQATKQHH
jgi:hypothetical protein